jgi:hypothetical protein
MSTIDNGSHEGFYFTEDEDTNYPDLQPVHGGSGREEYGSESSSEDDLDNDQLAEDFSSLELEQRMRSRRRSSKHARGGGTNHRIASAEAKECRQGGRRVSRGAIHLYTNPSLRESPSPSTTDYCRQ